MIALIIVTAILNAVILSALVLKLLHVFQLGGYRTRLFARWSFINGAPYILTLLTVGLIGFGAAWVLQLPLTHVLRQPENSYWAYFFILVFWAFAIAAVVIRMRAPVKVPFRYTPRVRRLLATVFLISAGISFVVLYFARTEDSIGIQYAPLLAIALPAVMLLANVIISPIEWVIRQYYLSKAKRKLFSPQYKDLIRIGITGSYGKTSCKNILQAMLSQKYKTAASPQSYNTPMGFCKTVNDVLKPDDEVLIMEMGARYRGDIKYMCKLFKPMHGMLTSIGLAHLETFKTPENIKAEKYELINVLPPDGIRVIGGETVDNTALCFEMAKKLGLTDKQIAEAIAKMPPVPHRLEHITTEQGVHILDDSYNSNPHGIMLALNKLKELKKQYGGHAYVLTPGMVELGSYQYSENHKFGKEMATVADKVFVVGNTNREAIKDGLVAGGFTVENILFSKTLEESKAQYAPVLQKNDVLLIENDLPDNFI